MHATCEQSDFARSASALCVFWREVCLFGFVATSVSQPQHKFAYLSSSRSALQAIFSAHAPKYAMAKPKMCGKQRSQQRQRQRRQQRRRYDDNLSCRKAWGRKGERGKAKKSFSRFCCKNWNLFETREKETDKHHFHLPLSTCTSISVYSLAVRSSIKSFEWSLRCNGCSIKADKVNTLSTIVNSSK